MRAVFLDADDLQRAGARIVAYRSAQTTRRDNGRRLPLTQTELARRAGVSIGTLQGLELGTRRTGRRQLQKIANAIGMTIDELVAPEALATRVVGGDGNGAIHLTPEALLVARSYSLVVTPTRVEILYALKHALANRTDAPAVELLSELRVLLPDTADTQLEKGVQESRSVAPPGSIFRETLRNGTRSE